MSLHKIYVMRSRPLHKIIPSELCNDFGGGVYVPSDKEILLINPGISTHMCFA